MLSGVVFLVIFVDVDLLLLLLLALGRVVELEGLVHLLTAEVGIGALGDLLLGVLKSLALDVEAVDVVELHRGLLSLVTAAASWNGTLGEAGLAFALDVLHALDRFLLGQGISLGVFF